MNTQTRHLSSVAYRVGAIQDSLCVKARPGVVVVGGGTVVAAGSPDQVSIEDAGRVVDLPDRLVVPSLVNAHAHLDLTAVGPQLYEGDFIGWLGSVIELSPKHDADISRAVRRGLTLSRRAGVGYVGDIAHTTQAVMARAENTEAATPGIGFLEWFGIGARQAQAVDQLREQISLLTSQGTACHPLKTDGGAMSAGLEVLPGIQPHAPYSAGLGLYDAAAELAQAHGWRLCTHLAETPEEIAFVRDAQGPFVELLKRLGRWDDTIRPTGQHPIDWLEPVLSRSRWLLVHCNYVDDRHIEVLTRCRASVAYCPIASDYFGHHQPHRDIRHRYREMLEAGVNVCLGTDSILCHPTDDPQPLSIGSQMRHLYRRDRTDPDTLLKMATVNGIAALGLPRHWASLGPGAPALLTCTRIDPADPTDPLAQALGRDDPFEALEDYRDDPV